MAILVEIRADDYIFQASRRIMRKGCKEFVKYQGILLAWVVEIPSSPIIRIEIFSHPGQDIAQ
jgi:hypothetical protein